MGPSHLGVYLCKAENEIGGDEGGVTLSGVTHLRVDNCALQSDHQPTVFVKMWKLSLKGRKRFFYEYFSNVENQFTGENLTIIV